MTITTNFMSICQRCVWETHPTMLTTYCLRSARCDRCGNTADLAQVKRDGKLENEKAPWEKSA